MKGQRHGYPISALMEFVDYLKSGGRDPIGRESLNPIFECEKAALALFTAFEQRHGRNVAYRIFNKFGTPPGADKTRSIKNHALLDLYDAMPEPNVQQLAWKIAAENKARPQAERLGPRGSTNPMSIDKHIRRLLEEREDRMKKGTWWGPLPPDKP